MIGRVRAAGLVAAGAAILSGCATPSPVRQLADRTGANASFLSSQLERLAQDNRRLAGLRAAALGNLYDAHVRIRLARDIDLEVMERAGAGARLELLRELRSFSRRILELHAESEQAATTRRHTLLAGEHALTVPSAKLSAVAKGLSALGTDKDRMDFLVGYAKQVAKEYEAREKAGRAATDKLKVAVDRQATKAGDGP